MSSNKQAVRDITPRELWDDAKVLHNSSENRGWSAVGAVGVAVAGELYHFGLIHLPMVPEAWGEGGKDFRSGVEVAVNAVSEFGTPFFAASFLYFGFTSLSRHRRAVQLETSALNMQEARTAADNPAHFCRPDPEATIQIVHDYLNRLREEHAQNSSARPQTPPGPIALPSGE